jgi:hypothetical protein
MRGMTGYNGVLTLGSDAEGVYLGVMFLFRFAHPPLFIPWSDVAVEEPTRWFFFRVRKLRLGSGRILLKLREPLARFLLAERPTGAPTSSGIQWGI